MKILISIISFFITAFALYAQIRGGEVQNTTTNEKSNHLYGLVIGISDYKEIKPLNYADNDADLVAQILESNFGQSSKKIIKLTNQKANEYSILNGISQITKQVKENDLVVFYFAGHGGVANINSAKKGYLLAHDASSSQEYDAGGAVKFDVIYDSISKILSKKAKVYMITDACHSGAATTIAGSKLSLEAWQNIEDASTRFLSCKTEEVSYEYDSLQHGVFTYYLAKGIGGQANNDGDNSISIDELNQYLKSKVSASTKKLQNPNIKSNDGTLEIFIPDNSILSYLDPNTLSNELASRGTKKTQTTSYTQFINAINNDDLFGKSSSAKFIYESSLKTKSATSEEIISMKDELVEALLQRSQKSINHFLKGQVSSIQGDNYLGTIKDLKTASELLGFGHFLTKTLEKRAHFFEAMEIIRSKDFDNYAKAENLLLILTKEEPNIAYYQQGLAMLYVAKNNKVEADKQLNKLQQIIPVWTKPQTTKAQLNLISGNLDVVLNELNNVDKNSIDKSDVYFLRAQMHLANFELKAAEKEIQLLKNASPGSYKIERELIVAKIESLRGRIKKADDIYNELSAENSNNIELLLKLAEHSISLKDTSSAIKYYQTIKMIQPNHKAATNGLLLYQIKKTAGISLNYYDYQEVLTTIQQLESTKKYTEALPIINKAIEINNWSPEYYYLKGKIEYALNQKYESIESLKKAIQLSPYHFESIRALSYIYIEQKKNIEADALIKLHDKYFKNSAKWLCFQVKAYQLMGSKNDLFVLLEKAIKLDSFDLEPYRALIKLHIDNNGYLFAQKELKNLLGIGGNEADEKAFMYWTEQQVLSEFAKKRYGFIVDGAELLIEQNEFDPNYLYMGAISNYMIKDYEKASKHIKSLAKLNQTLSPASLLEFYKLKGMIALETNKFEEAEIAFKMYNANAQTPCYLGLAMAQYELGNKESWIQNLKKDFNINDFNEDAYLRFEKMKKKAGL